MTMKPSEKHRLWMLPSIPKMDDTIIPARIYGQREMNCSEISRAMKVILMAITGSIYEIIIYPVMYILMKDTC